MLFHFYDIESLDNIFTVAIYEPENNILRLFYLCDIANLVNNSHYDLITDEIHARNKNFDGKVVFYDLHSQKNVELMTSIFGASNTQFNYNDTNKMDSLSNKFRLKADTDADYDKEKDPFLLGYNSYNYDTTMLAHYFDWSFYTRRKAGKGKYSLLPVTARDMFTFNNILFDQKYKNQMYKALLLDENFVQKTKTNGSIIRRNMILSGRHLDVARLNEKQSFVGLKRLLGSLGLQIFESKELDEHNMHIDSVETFASFVAYNASDVINLNILFNHPVYKAQFDLKQSLLETYPELIYNPKKDDLGNDTYIPDTHNSANVRADRLAIDSSSAQFATKCLCPYGHLKDIPTVSFMYPSKAKAQELGIERVDVLEETKKFFYDKFPQENLRVQFDRIYNYYKQIEGKNFNDSDNYQSDYGFVEVPITIKDIKDTDRCLPYFDKDGSTSGCYVQFSIGGIHGAEYNQERYEKDLNEYETKVNDIKDIVNYGKFVAIEQGIEETDDDILTSKTIKYLMKNEPIITSLDGRKIDINTYITKDGKGFRKLKKPVLIKEDVNGKSKLSEKYTYTSVTEANHEDFKSYYPNLLRMLSAFYNEGLGYDRYAEIFEQKEKYGKLMKDKSLPQQQRDYYKTLREGTKLILNSASGAADTYFKSPIQMNNLIISMRVIGQMFSYRIGQAQTYEGARIVSTNTDGLYSVMEEKLNNEILARESANIGVEIEPERLFLVSKDSNNRMELETNKTDIISTSGGLLACMNGPTPSKSLAHPAIVDWVIGHYMIYLSGSNNVKAFNKPMDKAKVNELLAESYNSFLDKPENKVNWLKMFQNIIASSPDKNTYNYGVTTDGIIKLLQRYNRIFIMKDDLDDKRLFSLRAAYTPKRKKQSDSQEIELEAQEVLNNYGVYAQSIPECNISIRKLTGIETTWKILILNDDLNYLPDETFEWIKNNLAYEHYAQLVMNAWESWSNEE